MIMCSSVHTVLEDVGIVIATETLMKSSLSVA